MKKLYSLVAVAMISAASFAQTATFNFGTQGYANAQVISSGVVDANVSFTTSQNTGSNPPTYYTTGAAIRFYADSSTGIGGGMTLTPANGKKITNLVISAVSSTYAPQISYSVDGGSPVSLTASSAGIYTISGINAVSSLTFYNNITGTSTQLRIPSIEVTYTGSLAVNDIKSIKNTFVKNTLVENEINFGAKAEVKIFSTNGQIVKSASVSENKSLEVSDLAPGMYIVTGMVDGQAVSTKIVKK
ncbi:T9SS type A sorting domain-containing protein [Frigoriflavimonas asaccharolytica]|uniref:Secretion system C-terminal sorting domain-containing protein n=1 Tax=Frigoriflavimonas asaccharolytica TaxID=2735899 RepID=A0A8J8K8V2_9FLAO|nr:T9SS type A sorting domain-containing protein [Frigoriflavimonas asaccharolytica]NRS92956.1 hypothetical protein [Frigoriflavimonas asaccharolytica]